MIEWSIVPADRAYRIPDAVSDADAVATLIAFQTAHLALHRRGALSTGETLLVLGAAGGVGSAAIQLGKDAGARVIAVARDADKQDHCRALGADVVLDSASGDLAADIRAATDGRGNRWEPAGRCYTPADRGPVITGEHPSPGHEVRPRP